MKGTFVIIAAIMLLTFSFLLFTDISFVQTGYGKAKFFLADGVGPVLQVMKAPVRAISYIFDGYINLVDVKEKNTELRKRVEELEMESQKMADIQRENKRLKELLDLEEQQPNEMIASRIVGEDLTNWFRCVVIDKGRNAGIRERMPVITPLGVVGQAVEVNDWHTKVMVINDTNSAVDVFVAGKDTRGIAEGTGRTTLRLKYVLKNDQLEVGDRLVTSGKDAIFPRGIAVGIVISVNKNSPGLFSEVEVMPYNNFRKLDAILVVKKP